MIWPGDQHLKLGKSSAFVKRDLRAAAADGRRVRGGFLPRPQILHRTPGSMEGTGQSSGNLVRCWQWKTRNGRRPPSTTSPRSWPMPCTVPGLEIISGHGSSICGIVRSGRNCYRTCGSLTSRLSLGRSCRGSTRRPSSGYRINRHVMHRRSGFLWPRSKKNSRVRSRRGKGLRLMSR